jgi:hypothetical protein
VSIVVKGLPVLVETGDHDEPLAFWWQNRRRAVFDRVCHWEDVCLPTAHWLVQLEDGQHVSLLYDRDAGDWLVECIDSWWTWRTRAH